METYFWFEINPPLWFLYLIIFSNFIISCNKAITKVSTQIKAQLLRIESLKEIRQRGYKIVAVSPEKNATILPNFRIDEPIALTFGTEWEGISEEILDFADETLMIPMYGFTQSFNVSVAAAICLYELKQKLVKTQTPHLLNDEKRLRLKIRWAVNSIRSGGEILERYLCAGGL